MFWEAIDLEIPALCDGYDQPLLGGPVDRGFDAFFGIRASTDIPPTVAGRSGAG